MSNPIYNLFKLVLTSFFDFILNYIYKITKLFKTTVKEGIKLLPYNGYNNYVINFLFIVL